MRALAYGRLKSDAIGPIGIATEAHVWPRLTELQELRKFADWAALEEWWRSHLGSLADEIEECAGRVAAVLEGGYNVEALAASVIATIGMLGATTDDGRPTTDDRRR